jgi:hypothetical protein
MSDPIETGHADYAGMSGLLADLKDSGSRQEFGTGAVRDDQQNKGAFHLVPPFSMLLVSLIFEMGARKYAARNWEKGMPVSRYIESGLRHTYKYIAGLRDEPHLAMACWNFLCALWTATMVALYLLPAKLNDMPCHVGRARSWAGYPEWDAEGDLAWEAPPISPVEFQAVKQWLA